MRWLIWSPALLISLILGQPIGLQLQEVAVEEQKVGTVKSVYKAGYL